MHIGWSFLDKRNATIKAIEAHESMDFIIAHTAEDIVSASGRADGVGAQCLDGMPHVRNPKANEERVLAGIEEIDTIRERYRQAMDYKKWFDPVWEQLSEDERYVLGVFYMDGHVSGSAAASVAEHLGVERSSAYNKKNRALEHMTTLLYGKY